MPELPEVEIIRRDLQRLINRKKIIKVDLLYSRSALNTASFFKKNLIGNSFVKLGRKGKLLYFEINTGKFLLIHLKMTGQLIYVGKKIVSGGHTLSNKSFLDSIGGELPNRYTRIIFSFIDGSKLYFNDLRKFAYLKIINKEELNKILKNNYGIEPLTKEFNWKKFRSLFNNRRTSVKALLLNQRLIAGLGNIYTDESLFLSRIRPDRKVDTLSEKEIRKLFQVIPKIIKKALEARGTTFKDYRDSEGKKGNFSSQLKVYGRDGKKCLRCGGLIVKTKVAGRGTRYCSSCQH